MPTYDKIKKCTTCSQCNHLLNFWADYPKEICEKTSQVGLNFSSRKVRELKCNDFVGKPMYCIRARPISVDRLEMVGTSQGFE